MFCFLSISTLVYQRVIVKHQYMGNSAHPRIHIHRSGVTRGTGSASVGSTWTAVEFRWDFTSHGISSSCNTSSNALLDSSPAAMTGRLSLNLAALCMVSEHWFNGVTWTEVEGERRRVSLALTALESCTLPPGSCGSSPT